MHIAKFSSGRNLQAVQAIGNRIFGHTTMTISNVKGPDEEISVFGHSILYIAGGSFIGSQVYSSL